MRLSQLFAVLHETLEKDDFNVVYDLNVSNIKTDNV